MVAMSVAEQFRAQLSEQARPHFVDDGAIDVAIGALAEAGTTAWSALVVDRARFAGDVARRLGDTATPSVLNGLHHDIWLAVACAGGDARAIAIADGIVELECGAAARRLGATPAQGGDLVAVVRTIVFVDEETRQAAIRQFTGRGDLRGYVRIVAARALVRIMQRDQREVATDDDTLAALGPALSSSLEPEIALLRERHREDLDEALRIAITGLDKRPRAVLRYHLVDGWTVDRIGERYGVHRSTAARWVADARAEVGAAIRDELIKRLQITLSQVDSLVVMLTSGIDVSLERLL